MYFTLVDDVTKFIIEELRKYFAQEAPYDTFGDLIPEQIRNVSSTEFTKIKIVDEFPDADRQIPAIVVTGAQGPSREIGFGQSGQTLTEVVGSDTRTFLHKTGQMDLTITFAVVAKTTPQRAIISDRFLVGFAFKELLRKNLEQRAVILQPQFVRHGGTSEEPFGADIQKIYRANFSITVLATWAEKQEITGDELKEVFIEPDNTPSMSPSMSP